MTDGELRNSWGRVSDRPIGAARWLCIGLAAMALVGCVRSEESLSDNTGSGGGSTGGGTPPPGSPPPPAPPPPSPPPPPPPPPAPPTEQAAFEATLYPLLIEPLNFCVGCHGNVQGPVFASADPTAAYNAIISQQKVNLSNPELSRVYLRPKDDRHNCGGDASCDQIAAAFLTAIQDWAMQASAGMPPPAGQAVVSAATDFSQAMDGGNARVDDSAIAMFTFAEGAGAVTMDTSGVGAPITLQIEGMEWVDGGGLQNVSGKAQANLADSQKLFNMITPVGEYTVEAWVIPDNNAQDGPARMVSYSQDTQVRNFTLGQNAIYYQLRNRSAGTGANGTPALEALDPQVATNLTHVVTTFDAASGRKVYINGQLSMEENAPDTLDWLDSQLFVIGNEVTNDRLWQGVFRMVAVHNKALTGAEIQQNFDAGTGNLVTMRFDISAALGQTGYIDFQAAQIDAQGYLFANPTFVSDATNVPIKNIRIGVNGQIPVAAQSFRSVDTIATQSGFQISPLGAVVPVALGSDNDQFHLEFEMLAGQIGLAEPVAPSNPPAPVADVVEPVHGLRTFSQINDTMSSLTGVDANQGAVLARFTELRGSLPATPDMLTFAGATQIAIQRLATEYCGVLVNDAGSCDAFFGSCEIDGAAKDQVATTLYDNFIGDNIANQPVRAGVTAEIVSVIDDLDCAAGCNGVTAQVALQASCAAVLSSAALTVN